MKTFNITQVKSDLYRVKTAYNEFEIKLDEHKGIGIYMMFPNCAGSLIKQYHHLKIEVALNYLIKKYFI